MSDRLLASEETKSLIHFILPKDIMILEEQFAELTPYGWVIPFWITLMWATCGGRP